MQAEEWDAQWARKVVGDRELPPLRWPGEIVGSVTARAARATGLPEGTPVAVGTVDAWAEALSVGVCEPGDLMIMYGSTMFLVLYGADATFNPAIWTTVGVRPGTRSYAAGMATSGSLLRWLCDLCGLGFPEAAAAAAAVPPGADGLLCLPYFAGERSPLFDPNARGAFVGLALRHGPGHLIRAGYEAVAYSVRHNLEVMASMGVAPERVVAVGGGTTGGLWTQIVSDVCDLPQQVPEVTIGAAYGDTLLAATAVGIVAPEARWNSTREVVQPDPAARAHYDEAYGGFRELAQRLEPLSHKLAAAQQRSAKKCAA